MLNLIDILTEKDKEIFKQYMIHYSEAGDYYCGNEKFLVEWAKNKKRLYGLLGNKLKVKFPFVYEKDKESISNDLSVMHKTDKFFDMFSAAYEYIHCENYIDMDKSNYFSINGYSFSSAFRNNEPLDFQIKLKFLNIKKSLNLNKGMMPIRALGKVVNYIYDNSEKIREDYPKLKEEYELFRQKHSLIFNEKELKGDLVISIDPIDFVTMSNNASGWQSCMHWDNNMFNKEHYQQNSGCYHIGTIEMMNSNNVVCCYLEGKVPYTFYTDEKAGISYSCPNKKWRSLFIVTPEILLSGKGYPYQNSRFNYFILDKLKDLAMKNKNWKYKYGIEEYRDMKHIDSFHHMIANETFIEFRNTTKHNILLDTIGMYNDYFNDKDTVFYCYRNKVKHNIIITYSGKAICTCCGKQIIKRSDMDYYTDDYNDRFSEDEVGRDICYKCSEEFERCDRCGIPVINDSIKLKTVDNKKICYRCFSGDYKKCPSCNKVYNCYTEDYEYTLYNKKEEYDKEVNEETASWEYSAYLEKIHCCNDCMTDIVKNKRFGKLIKYPVTSYFSGVKRFILKDRRDDEEIKRFYGHNLIELTKEDFDNLQD